MGKTFNLIDAMINHDSDYKHLLSKNIIITKSRKMGQTRMFTDFLKNMKCKECEKQLRACGDYTGKGLCSKCYSHQYISNKWKNDEEYRKKQRERIDRWQKANHERVKEIARKCYHKKKNKL